ncbi:SRPBCC family protein [Flavobacterium hydatis]|uniref:Transcriptional regulator n=1 Tax=Flavobacterium hydatis TaxID=991 RepID=A0A086AE16_FLAHY|nr:transcriptional regulator [Flavobacterium hydatis]KFF14930.1 transcriptional regulator [Flavobacterium hydatis]OXA92614.1 transcriptional regulator [Flavobacterium hydatis]
MRILKYIFLLLLLSFVSLTVFVATQKGDFTVERSKVIKTQRVSLYNFVNDYRNWEDFGSWVTEDPSIHVVFPAKTSGVNASFSWTGNDGSGDVKTIAVTDAQNITQKMNFDGTLTDVSWVFKDTLGGTKVTWKSKGTMSFLFKIYSALNGGADKVIGTMYEKTLANLDKILVYETNTFDIKVDGVVKKLETFYINQSFTSEIGKIAKNVRIVVPQLTSFCEANGIETNGKPFVIYHTYDTTSGLAKISICVPIKKEIFTSSGSDILTGKLEPFEAVKTTLKGDYSHTKQAIEKSTAYINNQKIFPDLTWSHLEIYTISKAEIANPSKWVTELYYPVKPKVVPVERPVVRTPKPEPTPAHTPPPAKEEQSEF